MPGGTRRVLVASSRIKTRKRAKTKGNRRTTRVRCPGRLTRIGAESAGTGLKTVKGTGRVEGEGMEMDAVPIPPPLPEAQGG
jgi:hypothetical protein